MAMSETFKVATKSPNLYLSCSKGHFVTNHSHINYYIDITTQKSSLPQAKAVAKALLPAYKMSTMVDTILCLDGSEVIGTCLGEMLTRSDYSSVNSNREINILTPEYTTGNQLIFRDNNVSMIQGKSVLILAASVVTGYTCLSAIEAIDYYGGRVAGIGSVFSAVSECSDVPVTSAFDTADLPDYMSTNSIDCPMCKKKMRIDALINSFGCSKL